MRPVLDPASLCVPTPQVELRYLYEPGLRLLYRSTLSVLRVADASPHAATRAHEQFSSMVLLRVIGHDEADGGYFVLSYQAPYEHLVDGQPASPGAPRIIYSKHTPLGEVIEASDASEAATLLLPEATVGPGSTWNLTQSYLPPGRSLPLEVVSRYNLLALEGSLAHLNFEADEIRYQGDTPLSEGNIYTVRGKGSFVFDVELGALVSLETESTMIEKQAELLLEVVSLHQMQLAEE